MIPPTEKQIRLLWFSLTVFAIGVLLIMAGLLVWGFGIVLSVLAPVVLPLAVAGVIAYLLDPLVEFFERRRFSRVRSILLVALLGLIIVGAFAATVLPRVIFETEELIAKAPEYSRALQHRVATSPILAKLNAALQIRIHSTNAPPPDAAPAEPRLDPPPGPDSQLSEKVLTWFAQVLPAIGSTIAVQLKRAASWIGLLIGFFLVPIYVFYFLLEKKGIQQKWSDYLPLRQSRLKEEVIFVLSSINDCLIVFFRGQVLVALCSGSLLTLGFLILGLNYAVLLGVMAGLLGIVPYLGTLISLVPALTLAAVQFGDWVHPLIVLAIFAAVNLLESLVVSPRIIGQRVGLHPLTIIIAVMIGTNLLGGIVGGVLAIPLTAALRAVMFRYVWKKPVRTDL